MRMKAGKTTKALTLILALAVCIAMSAAFAPTDYSYGASIGKVSKLSATIANAQVSLSWSKASNAKKYQVYTSTSAKGKYTRLKTVSTKSCKFDADFGLHYFKVRGINSSGSAKGAFSSPKPVYAMLGICELYKSFFMGSTIIQVGLINGSAEYPTTHGISVMGMKSVNSPYYWKIFVCDKSTGKVVKSYKALHCNAMATVLNSTYIGKNTSASVMCETVVGTAIPSAYLNTDNYELVVRASIAPSKNYKKGMAFYVYCSSDLAGTDGERWR